LAKEEKLQTILNKLERSLRRRVVIWFDENPEGLFDEIANLDLVLSVRQKMRHS
jgi:hypothetical protein